MLERDHNTKTETINVKRKEKKENRENGSVLHSPLGQGLCLIALCSGVVPLARPNDRPPAAQKLATTTCKMKTTQKEKLQVLTEK